MLPVELLSHDRVQLYLYKNLVSDELMRVKLLPLEDYKALTLETSSS